MGLESVPMEVREFPDETAELEALLLENAIRSKTTEQKVREAIVWKDLEASKAKKRQFELAGSRPNTESDLCENFRTGTKGRTVDRLAARVGLGSGRNYEKAVKVVGAIDSLLEGAPETAIALRQVLNERSVDAATKLLKRISLSDNRFFASLDNDSPSTSNSCEGTATDPQRTCWNCQYRGESIENHSFYCNRLGLLSLIDKSADKRGAECDLWNYRVDDSNEVKNKTQFTQTFTLTLPTHLQPLLQDAAHITGMSVVDWVTGVLESAALATCTHPSARAKVPERK